MVADEPSLYKRLQEAEEYYQNRLALFFALSIDDDEDMKLTVEELRLELSAQGYELQLIRNLIASIEEYKMAKENNMIEEEDDKDDDNWTTKTVELYHYSPTK